MNSPVDIPAVILAAGQGKRLRPYTEHLPKPMIELGGVPLLGFVLINLLRTGLRKFCVVVGYMAEKITSFLQRLKEGNVPVLAKYIPADFEFSTVYQVERNGTGAAALLAEDFIRSLNADYFLLTYGDILVSPSIYERLIESFLSNGAEAYLVGNPTDDPSAGAAVYYEGDRVIRMIEKPGPGAPPTDMNNAGIYIFGKNIFDALKHTPLSPRGEIELTAPIIEWIENGKYIKLVKMNREEFWCDVGTVTVYNKLKENFSVINKKYRLLPDV